MLIAFDTSGPFCTTVVARPDGVVVASAHEEIGRGHAEHLMPQCESLMGKAGFGWSDITLVGCTVGPGSFTGLRVGLAAAKGFAQAIGRKAVGVSVLEALALPFRGQVVSVVQDARRGEIWLQNFGVDGNALDAARGVPLAKAASHIADESNLLVGSGAEFVCDNLGRRTEIESITGIVAPQVLAQACLARTDPAPLRPLYLRAADAKPQTPLQRTPAA